MQYPPKSYELGQQIIRLIRTTSDPQALLSGIAPMLGTEFKADACLVVAGTNSLETLQTAFWNGGKSSVLPAEVSEQLVSNFLAKEMAGENPCWEISDLEAISAPASVRWLGEMLSVRSLLGMATHFQGNANGIIVLGNLRPHEWTTKEKALLQVVAESAAVACSVAQVQKTFVDRESPVTLSRTLPVDGSPLFRRWYELTRQQLEQQRQLNELKNEIITAISDRARNPLASMKMVIEMLSGSTSQNLPPESQQRYWKILKQAWHSLNDLITNIVTLQKLGSQELTFNPETVTLMPLIHELSRSFQEQWQEDKRKRLTLVVDEQRLAAAETAVNSPLTLYTDSRHLRSILVELLTNAGNFSLPGTTVTLNVREERRSGNDRIVMAVVNQGRGISPEEQKYIFEPFRRGQGVVEQAIAGTGLGLALVKGLVELLNGTIEVSSHPTDEDPQIYITTFTLTLPQ